MAINSLISKVQYKRSEKGEFHEISERSLGDTLSLVHGFPWRSERNLASVELTCPSITVEHPHGTYLKLGPYFGGKFTLYYFDIDKRVYFKVVNTLEEACVCIKAYYEQEGKMLGFEKYSFTFNPSSHFHTDPFEYTINAKATVKYFGFPIIIISVFVLLGLFSLVAHPENFSERILIGMILFSFLFLFFSPLIYFYFNYRAASKGQYLQLSRGNDFFTFGIFDKKKVYNKADVKEIAVYGTPATQSPWKESEVFVITFKNGERIKFTSLLIIDSVFRAKFPDHSIKDIQKYFPTFDSA